MDALRGAPPGEPLRARLAFGFVALAVVLGTADRESPRAGPPLRVAGQPTAFSAGQVVDGLPLAAVLTREDTGSVSFVYGDCVPDGDAGCAPPAEVQVWPACRRSLASYERDARSPRPAPAVLRGAPAAFFEDGLRLEVQTGASTIVVFGDSRARTVRVAAALESLDGSVRPGTPFPPPVPGAVEGRLGC